MCKIVTISSIQPNETMLALKFSQAIAPIMSKNDNDGFGYAAITKDGTLFAERWLNNKDAFKYRVTRSAVELAMLNAFGNSLLGTNSYNSHGTIDFRFMRSLTLHARMATNSKSIENTHPFIRDNVSLIHNGIVQGDASTYNQTSSNDSELILNSYIDHGVMLDGSKISNMLDSFSGYQACSALFTLDGRPMLDVWRDDKAQLWALKVSKLSGYVFATDPKHVYAACKALRWHVQACFKVKDNTFMRVDVLTGEVILTGEIVTRVLPTLKESDYWDKYKGYHESEDKDMINMAAIAANVKRGNYVD